MTASVFSRWRRISATCSDTGWSWARSSGIATGSPPPPPDAAQAGAVLLQRLLNPGAVGGLHLAEVGHLLLGAPLLTLVRCGGLLLVQPLEGGEQLRAFQHHLLPELPDLGLLGHGGSPRKDGCRSRPVPQRGG